MGIQREVTRLKAIASTPTIQAFKEEVEGTATINFFSASRKLFNDYLRKMDDLQKNIIVSTAASEWFNICISMLSLVVVIPCIVFSVSFFNFLEIFPEFFIDFLAFRVQHLHRTLRIHVELSVADDQHHQILAFFLQ